MMKKYIINITLLLTSMVSSAALAHTGFHNDIYHPLSGIDHFLVMLIVGLLAGVATYYFYKK